MKTACSGGWTNEYMSRPHRLHDYACIAHGGNSISGKAYRQHLLVFFRTIYHVGYYLFLLPFRFPKSHIMYLVSATPFPAPKSGQAHYQATATRLKWGWASSV